MPSVFKSLGKALKGSSLTSKPQFAQNNGDNHGGTAQLNSNTSAELISLHDAQAAHNATLHQDAHPDGGLACNNDTLLKEQREAITAWITSMGKKIFTGNFNLISTPFPVVMFEPRSYLEKLADVWVYPRYLQQASASTSPLERMKLVVTWFIAGLHHGFEKWKKPFNPILGETWQATLSDGSHMYMEQISHHPPVTAFNLHGPGGSYRFTGLSQPNVAIVLKYYGFKTVAKGFRYVDFPDGTRIDIHYPGYYIKGVVYSTRPRAEVDGSATFTDVKNRLRAVVRFGPNKGARATILRRSDAVIGEIYEMSGGPSPDEGPSVHHDDLCVESSSDLIPTKPHKASHGSAEGSTDSDGFETASESEWELRELRDVAEEQRDTDSPITTARHQRTTSQHRVLSDAAAIAAITGGSADLLDVSEGDATNGVATGPSSLLQQDAPYLVRDDSIVDTVDASVMGSSVTGVDSNGKLSATRPISTGPVSGPLPVPSMGSAVSSGQPTSKEATAAKRLSEPGRPSPQASASVNSGLLSGFSRMMGLSGTSAVPQPSGEHEATGTLLASLEGSWLSHVNIDGRRYWTLATETPATWCAVPDPLASDCRYRQDLVMTQQGDFKAAQRCKEELENLQRRDKKLREAGGAASSGH